MVRCVVVDDEELARKRLKRLISKHARKIEIIAEFGDAPSVLKFIKYNEMDCIFLDIEMPGLRGIDALNQIPEAIKVIFTTAYKDYAIDAFEHDAFDYLLKPISQERLDKAIIKLLTKGDTNDITPKERVSTNLIRHIPISGKDGITFVELDAIAFFQAESKYVVLNTLQGDKHLLSYTLIELENKLNEFIRIQKGLLINTKHIQEVKTYFNFRFKIILKDKNQTELISGRSYAKNIQALSKL
jgi:two-component system LytT family response regulator